MRVIQTLTIVLLVFCVIAGLLAAAGLGIGFAITWYFSSIALGHAAIAGCVIAATSAHFMVNIIASVQRNAEQADGDVVNDDSILILPRDISRHLAAKSKPRSKRK